MKSNLFIDGVNSFNERDGRRLQSKVKLPDPKFVNRSRMDELILPIGIISGSSQLTASFDQRYIVCGTVNIDSYLDNYIFISSGSFGG
jgi:hypothetical protein